MDIKQQFWQRVRALRKQQGFTQEDFARFCKINRSYMWVIERGEKSVTIDTVEKLALALEVPIGTLFEFWDEDDK